MILDLSHDDNNGILRFEVNNVDQGICFNDISRGKDIKYRMAVSLGGKHEKVELIKYECKK